MNLRDRFAAHVAVALARTFGVEADPSEVSAQMSRPPKPELGDVAYPCFAWAKALRQSPAAIASRLASALVTDMASDDAFAQVEAAGPYVNVRFARAWYVRRVLEAASAPGYGGSMEGSGRVIGIDSSAPNIAKPFGIGHLRSTVIGHSLRRIHEALGYRVVSVNHLGDWGTQFGKLMHAFELWGDEAEMEAAPIRHLYDLYVRFHAAAKEDPSMDEAGRAWFRRLEQGDPHAQAYWERFRTLSLREFQRMYDRLGVSFDHDWGEAFYNDKLDAVIGDLRSAGLLQESEGAQVVPLEDLQLPPCLILKQDGASLYATRDLAAARWRREALGAERFLYVVGAAQAVHFQQVFAVLERMGYPWAKELVHVPFGMILGISTRKGTLVFLEDVLDRGKALALEVLETREGLSAEERDTIAEQVAVGAIVFYDLMRDRLRDYEFNWELMLDWHGRTGPYLQYTHVRLASVERTFEGRFGALPTQESVDPALLQEDAVYALVGTLARFPEVVAEAARQLQPVEIARYLLDLAEAFNTLYSSGVRLVGEDEAMSRARIYVVGCVRQVLARGLTLLGVPLPERM